MNSRTVLIGIVGIILVGVVGYFFMQGSVSQQVNTAQSAQQQSAVQADGAETAGQTQKSPDAMMPNDAAMTGADSMEKDGAVMPKDSMADEAAMMPKSGTYEEYNPTKLALANTGTVVLFFRASWCPTCRAVDADIRKNISSIPQGVAILDVNYDTETALKQKYGVTYQHTFVQVDASGTQIAKWSGSPTLAALLANIR